MNKNKRNTIFQIMGLIAFCAMAAASSSSQQSTSRNVDWRGAAVGAAAGYDGYIIIGSASSDSEAKKLAASKGYSYYIYDTINGNVYAK